MARKNSLDRRDFVKSVALGTVTAGSLLPWKNVLADDASVSTPFPESEEAESDKMFPQGVGSGDPRPDGFLLWTRTPSTAPLEVRFQVAESMSFDDIVRHGKVTASPDSDFTIRIRLEGLEPNRRYWYRFQANDVSSPIGRTRTAPLPDDDHPTKIAFASCQDYIGRWFHAWRVLAERAEEIDFVLFLGDYIYEYERYPQLQEPQPGRSIKLPDGLVIDADEGIIAAHTLADYRELYRTARSDKNLREIHRLCPFVIIWDDHEHANDAWQDHAVDFNDKKGSEKDPTRRQAATRAWFEYLPIDVDYHADRGFPDDIVTWRKMRWGKHLDVFLTDERYYRDDHLVPEGPLNPRVGKLLPFSPLGSRTMCVKSVFDELEAKSPRTMLGHQQRDWLIESARGSDATWKVWASALMVSPFILDLRQQKHAPPAFRNVFYFKTDQWDGFPSERNQILRELSEVSNLVVLSGDLHGFYAAEIRSEWGDLNSSVIGAEFTVAGISSISLQEQVDAITASQPLLAKSGFAELSAQLDDNLRESSPHFVHANSQGYGLGIASFGADQLEIEFLVIGGVREPEWDGKLESIRFGMTSGRPTIQVLT
ncbi:alkaline phosphatase D family protein [bacterium]|nr:alkaline phosphatase D family protein [bacterium]